jgi:hypothetical protein
VTDGLITVIDALQDLVEPDTDVTIDRAASQPYEYLPNTLYAWEEGSSRRSFESGPTVREDFEILLVYVVAAAEEALLARDRDVSIALDTKRTAYLDAIRQNSGIPPWSYITASSDPDMIRQFEVRGIAIRVSGYRIID